MSKKKWIIDRKNLGMGIFICVSQILVIYNYLTSNCVILPRLPEICGENARSYLVGVYAFFTMGLLLIFKSIKKGGL